MGIHASNNPFSCAEASPGGGAAIWGGITGDIENQEDLIALLGSLNTPSTLEKQFGAGAVTITAGANTTPQEICDHINSVGFTVTAGQLILLALTVKKTVSGQAYWYRQKRLFKRNNLVGTWGTGSTNGEIVPADILALVYDVVQSAYTDSEDNVFINLGDLGSTAIHTYLNAFAGSIPGLTANELVDDGSIYYFECIIGEVYQTYKYIGSVPVTLGSGGDTVDSGDFDLYSSSGVESSGLQTAEQTSIADTGELYTATNVETALAEVKTQANATDAAVTALTSSFYNVLDYGAKGDGIQLLDGAITASDNTFTSASASFTSDDIGKVISIQGAGASGAYLVTTIASINSSTSVELTLAASTTVSAKTFVYGNDDTTFIQDTIQDCFDNGGGTVYLPNGIYIINGALQNDIGTDLIDYNSQLYIPRQSETEENLVTVVIEGETPPYVVGGTGINTIESPQLTGVVLLSTIQGSGTNPSILCSRGKNSGGFFDTMNNAQTYVRNLSLLVTPNQNNKATMGAINCFKSIVTGIDFVVAFIYNLNLFNSQEPNVINVTGISYSGVDATKQGYIKNVNVGGFTNGYHIGEHGLIENAAANCCVNAILQDENNHTSTIVKFHSDWCKYGITSINGNSSINVIDFMTEYYVGSKWYDTVAHIYDPSDYLRGKINFNLVQAGVGLNNSLFTSIGGNNLIKKPISFTDINDLTVTGVTDSEKLESLLSALVNYGIIKYNQIGLIHEYLFEDNLDDNVGSVNGTGTDITYVSGDTGKSASFNGTSSFIDFGDDDTLSFTEGGGIDKAFEIEFDVVFNTVESTFLLNKRSTPSGDAYEYQINYNGTAFVAALYSAGGVTSFMTKTYTFTPTAGVSYNIKLSYNGSKVNSGITLEIDGVSGGTGSTTGTYLGMSNTAAKLFVGKRGIQNDLFLDGTIDNLKISLL